MFPRTQLSKKNYDLRLRSSAMKQLYFREPSHIKIVSE